MKKLLVVLACLIFPFPAFAEVIGKGQIAGSLNICKSSRNGRLAVVVDTDDNSDVIDGGGSTPSFAICKSEDGGSTWNWKRIGLITSLDDYVRYNSTGEKIITISGNGSSFSIVAGIDNFIKDPSSFYLASDEAAIFTEGVFSAEARLHGGGPGPKITLDATTGDAAIKSSTVTIESADGGSGVYVQDGSVNIGSGVANVVLDEATGSFSVIGCIDYGKLADYSTIAIGKECDKFFDLTLHVPCFYNGTAWKSVIDGTTTCTASQGD